MPRSDFDDDDDDRPRSRRRRDADPPRKSGMSVWLILGIVLGGLLLVCGIGGAAVVVGLVLPAAQRVKAKQAEMQAEQEKALKESEAASRQPMNHRVAPHQVSRLQAGQTLEEVEDILGGGNPASVPLVNVVTGAQANQREASGRWQAAHRVGKVYVWQNRDDHVLIAFTGSPNAGGTVNGVLTLIGGLGREPIRLPADKP